MPKHRIAALAALTVAAVAAAGVTAATRHAQTTKAAAADLAATTVSQSSTRTCTASDGAYRETTATYRGSATSSDPRLNGDLTIRAHSVVNTTTGLGWLDGTLSTRGSNGRAAGTIHAAISGGSAVGSVAGSATRPEARLVASFSSGFSQTGGFTSGKLGSGSASGAGVLYTHGDCRKAKQLKATVSFDVRMTQGQAVPRQSGDATARGRITLDVTRDASGVVTGGSVVFDVNYRFDGAVSIDGLALHQGAKGTNGPTVVDANVGTVVDADGSGNLTKVVGGVSASTMQALLAGPRGYYVELTTTAGTSGTLRTQL